MSQGSRDGKSEKVRGKSILNIGSRVVGRRHHSVNNPVKFRTLSVATYTSLLQAISLSNAGKNAKVSLDLSRLATTLNRLERSIQIGINKWYQSLLRNSE
ncbi:hypothetical protein Tco_1032415 [Tanacetum coccineum]|uniref:Uncharacterized protein n=1 Tax=Tanacetum coccineum TaxID=301880 RepID=A0ABQ5GDF6_9ASTR